MMLVNESGQSVDYWISCAGQADCGTIDVNGLANLPQYDNQTNVYVGFKPSYPAQSMSIQLANTGTGQQVEIALVAE